jgi:hypothetical protein
MEALMVVAAWWRRLLLKIFSPQSKNKLSWLWVQMWRPWLVLYAGL